MLNWKNFALSLASVVTLCSCGGGGSGGTANTTASPRIITTLAHLGSYNVSVSNGRAYFSNNNTGEIKSVANGGGAITTHYSTFASFAQVIHQGAQIYSVNSSTSGSVIALPDNSFDVTRLSANQNSASSSVDVVTDGTNAYWSAYDGGALTSHIVSIPIIPTGKSPVAPPNGASTDLLINFTLNGVARIARDGTNLFVLEGATGNLYKVNLTTRQVSTVATAIVPVSTYPTPLVAAGGYLYALANNTKILQINENTGTSTIVATANSVNGSAIKSDGSAVYWLDLQATGLIFRSFSSQTGQITNITAPFPATTIVYDYCIASGQLWWYDDSVPSMVTIKKVPVIGGIPVAVSSFAFNLNGNIAAYTFPYRVVSDSTNLYWITNSGIFTLPQTGGVPTIVTSNLTNAPYNYSMALTSSSIIWGQSGNTGIMEHPKVPNPVNPTIISQGTFPLTPYNLTADASSLYWAVQNPTLPMQSTLFSQSFSTGVISNLGTSSNIIYNIFPYLNSIYLVRKTPSGYTISTISTAGGAEVTLLSLISNVEAISYIFVTNNILYFTSSNTISGVGGVYALNLATLSKSTLASNVMYPNQLYVDNSNVYWSTLGPLGGGIYRTPILGGTVESIFYNNYGCGSITGDSTQIYWACVDIDTTNK
jgi:hypothetical protein